MKALLQTSPTTGETAAWKGQGQQLLTFLHNPTAPPCPPSPHPPPLLLALAPAVQARCWQERAECRALPSWLIPGAS